MRYFYSALGHCVLPGLVRAPRAERVERKVHKLPHLSQCDFVLTDFVTSRLSSSSTRVHHGSGGSFAPQLVSSASFYMVPERICLLHLSLSESVCGVCVCVCVGGISLYDES